ncbi:MAG: DNA-binding response regulator [Leptothrix sp. (in: Bacteria)]|nr:DNA-binding response regulator [Leptothrix sp. (in: b-proteobacteria)]
MAAPLGAALARVSDARAVFIGMRSIGPARAQAKPRVRFRTPLWWAGAPSCEDPAVPEAHTILVLDDDPDVGLAAQLLLQRRVAPVSCLRRPAELHAALDRLSPSLLLLDLNYGPGRTEGTQGLQLLVEVLARPGAPVVVVMTAYADIGLAVQAIKRGAFDFVAKPWDNVRLLGTCREALEHARPLPADRAAPAATRPLRSLATQERAAVLAAMAEAEGNLSAAARSLGLSRAALYRRLDKHGL